MSECLTPEVIDRYRRGAIDSMEELLAIDAHLTACAQCRGAVRSAASGVADERRPFAASLWHKLTPVAGESACLDDELIARYVDGEADDADVEIVEAHIADCARCAEDVASLRAFRTQMQTYDWTAVQTAAQPQSWWTHIRAWLTVSPRRWFALQTGGMAAAAAIAVLLVFWTAVRPLQTQVADLRQHVSQLQRTNESLEKQVSAITDLQIRLAQLQEENKKIQQDYKTAVVPLEQSQDAKRKTQNAILLALNDGGRRVTLDKQGNLAGLESLPPSLQREVKTTLTARQVRKPSALAGLIGKPGTLLSGNHSDAPFALLSPLGTVVQSDRPTFRWQPLSGATSYTIHVVDDANFNEVATSEPLTGMEWTMPNALKCGSIYRWYVIALKDGVEVQSPSKSGAAAKFKVLEQKKADELARAKQKYSRSHLTLGILYAEAGLLDDAEREFQSLLNANPKSPVARKLLRSVQSLRQK